MRNKQLTLGALLSYGAIIFNIISGLIYTPWMISVIGDEQYALYTLALSIINIFLLDFGVGSAVTKFLSNYYAAGQYKEANRFMGIVYKVFISISIIIAVCLSIFYIFIDSIYLKLTPDELIVFKNLYIIVSVYSVLSFPFTTYNGVLMANERFIEVKACNLGQKIFNVSLIIVFLLMGYSVYSLVLVNAISNALFVIVKYYFIKVKTQQKTEITSWDKRIAQSLFGYSAWITVMNLAHRCIFNIMPTIIASILGSTEVTLFSLAATLEGYIYTFADAINGMFMPKISRIFIEEDAEEKLTNLMIKVGKFHVFTIGIIYIGFICLGREFVVLWMREGYELIYWCAIVLIFPSLIYVPQQVARTALLAKDYVKEQAIVYIVMAVLNLLISFILLSKIGLIGAAISVCASYLVRTIGMNVLYYKKLPLNLIKYFKQVYAKWSIAAIFTMAFGVLILKRIVVSGWISFLLKGSLLVVFYGVVIFIVCLDSEMKKKILNKIKHQVQ